MTDISKMLKFLMMALLAVSLKGFGFAAVSANDDPDRGKYLGKFSDRSQSEESADCGGYNVSLWEKNGVITGSFSTVETQCYESPEQFFEAKFDPSSKHLEFTVAANDNEENINFFSGTLTEKGLVGEMEVQDSKKIRTPYHFEVTLKKIIE